MWKKGIICLLCLALLTSFVAACSIKEQVQARTKARMGHEASGFLKTQALLINAQE